MAYRVLIAASPDWALEIVPSGAGILYPVAWMCVDGEIKWRGETFAQITDVGAPVAQIRSLIIAAVAADASVKMGAPISANDVRWP